ncbi:retrovirus-related pol polyprotein from transposon TNT 1-94 [Tanacetum coccineum]
MVFHNEDGNPARANVKQALGSYERPHKGVKASANSDVMYFFTSAQDGNPVQDDVRLCLSDDLKKAQDHMSINTKFLNCLQPEWRKYVTIIRHNQNGDNVSYDVLYDSLLQFEPHVLASKAKKVAKNHDPLALIAHSNAFSTQSHASSSYSPQPYYITHPSSVVDDGRVGIQTKNASYGGNTNKNARRQNKNQVFNARNRSDESNQIVQRVLRTNSTLGKANIQCYNYNEKGHYARECKKPKVHDAKYFREQMLLTMKDEAGSNLTNVENDFMLDTSYEEDTLEELTVVVMLMARLQPADDNAKNVISYDAKEDFFRQN